MRSCLEWKDGKRSTMRLTSGISVSTANIRRSWCKGGSGLTSSISGMCLQRTRRIRFLKPNAKLIPLLMPDLGECERPGLTSRHGAIGNGVRSALKDKADDAGVID